MNRSEAGKLGAIKAQEGIKRRKILLREEYYKNPKLCEKCNSIISFENRKTHKFCSHSCAASFYNMGKPKYGIPSNKFCLWCGGPVTFGNDYCEGASKRISISYFY